MKAIYPYSITTLFVCIYVNYLLHTMHLKFAIQNKIDETVICLATKSISALADPLPASRCKPVRCLKACFLPAWYSTRRAYSYEFEVDGMGGTGSGRHKKNALILNNQTTLLTPTNPISISLAPSSGLGKSIRYFL